MRYAWSVGLLLTVSFLIHIINLRGLPLYLDEGIYIYWAKLLADNPGQAYISLLDGKTPLFMWLVAWVNQLVHDSLLSARLLAVISGLITALAWSQIVRKFTDQSTSLVFLSLILVTPYTYLLERMGFVDSTLTAFGSLALLSLIWGCDLIKQKKTVLIGIICFGLSGLALGLAYMTKTSAQMFLVLLVLIGLYLQIDDLKQRKIKRLVGGVVGLLIMYGVYRELVSYLRVGGQKYWVYILTKENQLSYSFSDIWHNLTHLSNESAYLQNFPQLLQYIYIYLGVLFLLAIVGALVVLRQNRRTSWLIVYCVVIYLGIFLSAKVMASRYFYPVVPPTIALASIGLISIIRSKILSPRILSQGLVIGLMILVIQISLMIVWPRQALYAADDQSYFVSSHLTALGLSELEEMVAQDPNQTVVGISGIWGVAEGANVLLAEKGVRVVPLKGWLPMMEPLESGECADGQILIDDSCYPQRISDISTDQVNFKYLYLSEPEEPIEVLQKMGVVEELKTFEHPYSGIKSYIIRLK